MKDKINSISIADVISHHQGNILNYIAYNDPRVSWMQHLVQYFYRSQIIQSSGILRFRINQMNSAQRSMFFSNTWFFVSLDWTVSFIDGTVRTIWKYWFWQTRHPSSGPCWHPNSWTHFVPSSWCRILIPIRVHLFSAFQSNNVCIWLSRVFVRDLYLANIHNTNLDPS